VVKAKETNLQGVLEGTKQYQVPLYQRVYSWRTKQLDQLWDDIVAIAEARRTDPTVTHFIGSLVLAASPDNAAVGLQKFLVVDGQQRLATLTLLLAALRDHLIETQGAEHRDRVDAQYLVNKYEMGAPAKLLPTQADRSAYLSVLRAAPGAGGQDAIGDAYRRFRTKIAEADDPEDPYDISGIENAVLRGLALVAVTAEPGDNAHRIFESLNNTGLKLTQSDLLKNYLFMRLGERAEPVYDSIWLPLERKLDSDSLELLFWLDLVQSDERIKQSDTYVGQQKRLSAFETTAEVETEIARIAELGDVLAKILNPSREPNPEIRRRLARIRAWGSATAYPVVMAILARGADGTATPEQIVSALTYLESYFVRRIVIGRATAGINRNLLQAVPAIAEADDVSEALRRYFSTGRKHFASNAQVRDAVGTVAFYWQGRAAQKKLILQWLEESYRQREVVSPENLTIEHVLPQTLSDDVRDELADALPEGADVAYEHERIVHTLGNLTLSGYNSEMSNSPFETKKAWLATSGLRMNQIIAEQPKWGPAEISSRAAELAERITELWPGPDESLVGVDDTPSELRSAVAAVVPEIPAGRWTSYGEVALVVGTHPQPLATVLASYAIPNAWRVLQAAGTISPGFRWLEPGRSDDPRAVLEAEGLIFDEMGRAAPDQFVGALELAAIAGYEVDAAELNKRRRPATNGNLTQLNTAQLGFWNRVKAYAPDHSPHIPSWGRPMPQMWFSVYLGTRGGAHIELVVNSESELVLVDFRIPNDKALFHRLSLRRREIEAELGYPLEWRELRDKKVSRILTTRDGDFRNEAMAEELVGWLVAKADDFARVFPKYV
jgi:alkylated DNA nucleotide flippase Atl1